MAAAAVFTAVCTARVVLAFVGGWGLLLLAMGLPFFVMTSIKMLGSVQLYRNHREIHLFEAGVVVVVRGRPTAFAWDPLTVTPNRLGDALLDVRLRGADGSEAVLVAGRFGDDTLARLTGTLQRAVG